MSDTFDHISNLAAISVKKNKNTICVYEMLFGVKKKLKVKKAHGA